MNFSETSEVRLNDQNATRRLYYTITNVKKIFSSQNALENVLKNSQLFENCIRELEIFSVISPREPPFLKKKIDSLD